MNFLRLKNIDEYSLDDPRRTVQHKKIILSKDFLKKLYVEWYSNIKDLCADAPEGIIIELGSGGGFLKDVWSKVSTSDILKLENNDYCFNALEMPFEDNSIAAFVMVDVFHHIPDCELLLKEMNRCLMPGGVVAMSEPCSTSWSRFIYKNFHHETFNEKGDWTIPGTGPMSDANGALPWIVFERDVEKFNSLFPNLTIEKIEKHTPLRYLLSGGVSMIQLVPNFSFGMLTFIDKLVVKINSNLALFHFIKLKKEE